MTKKFDVQASVVDLRRDIPASGDKFLIDTNVWYWVTYTRASLGSQRPKSYQLQEYTSYLDKALRVKAAMFCSVYSLTELAHLVEETERDIYMREEGQDVTSKEYRHRIEGGWEDVIQELDTAWKQIKQFARPLEASLTEADAEDLITKLRNFPMDATDHLVVNSMRTKDLAAVITDDLDFAVMPKLVVFTCNPRIIELAKETNRLVSR